ncbi:MAG: hypothetical protein ACRCT5_10845 [Tannerellaceae bacterium]
MKTVTVNTQKHLFENLKSFLKEVNDLFGRTKQGFFENKVRFLAKESMVFEGFAPFCPVNAILQALKHHKSGSKTPFSEGEKSTDSFNLAQKTALKTTNQPSKIQ